MAPTITVPTGLSVERADLMETLRGARFFLRVTVQGLTDDQARLRSTVSRLTLGGIVKHVTDGERRWTRFLLGEAGGPQGVGPDGATPEVVAEWEESMQMREHETLEDLLAAYAEVAAVTDEAIATVPDLDAAYPLPPAPWFEPGKTWSVRRTLQHIIAETAQHAGHADIIRESIDGHQTMA